MKKLLFISLGIILSLSFSVKAQNNALNFDGTDDYITTTNPGILGDSERTLEAWVKTTATSGEQLIASWGSDNTNGQRFTTRLNNIGGSDYSIRVEIKGGGFNGSTVVNDGNWHHVAVTYDPNLTSNKYKLYVDGVLDTENDIPQTINTASTTNVIIGRRINQSYGGYFNGTIDEVRIWNTARTQTELQANMNTEICQSTANLMAYFKFNEGGVESDNTAITSVNDISVNESQGTLHGFALTGTTSNFVSGASITTLETVDSSFTTSETTITANQAGATYQWVDCDNDNAPIEGETSQSFTPSAAGNYAVEISLNTCTILSQCINFGPGGACIDPSGLMVTNITAETADVSWSANSGETEWKIAYGAPGFDPAAEGEIIEDNDAEASETLSGLFPVNAYEVYVKSVCGEGNESEWVGPVSFTTDCGAISNFPYVEDFEGTTGNDLPNCWISLNENGDLDFWKTAYVNANNSRVAQLYTNYNNGNNNDYLIAPPVTLTGNEQLVFDARSSLASDLNDFRVVLSTTGTDAADFTEELLPLTVPGVDFSQYVINLDDYSGNVHLAIHVPADGNDGAYIYIDNFTVRTIPTCPQPSQVSVSDVTGNSATVNFVAEGEETEWEIIYGESGFDPATEGNTITDSDGVAGTTIDGLAPVTDYQVYVKAICSDEDESYLSGPISFTTGCASVNTFPYLEDFNNSSYNIPECWSVLNENGDYDSWKMYNLYGIDGGFSTGFYSDNNNGNNDDYLVSPQITLTGNEQLKFSVRARTDLPEDANDFKVLLSTTGSEAADFTEELLPLTEVSSTTYQDYIIDLSDYVGEIYISIYIPPGGLDGYYLYLDNFIVRTIPACTEPSQLEVAAVTQDTAELTWVAGNDETQWEIIYGEAGFDPSSEGESVQDNDGQIGITLENLDPQTTYDAYIKSICSEESESILAGPTSFTTACAVIDTFPYVEDFEGTTGSNLPTCWSIINNNGDYDVWKTITEYSFNNNRTVGLYTNYNNGNNDDYLILPQLSLTGTQELIFMAKSSVIDNPNDVSILLSTTGTEIEDFTEELLPVTVINSTEYQEYTIDLTAYTGDVYLAFYVAPNGADGGYIYIDDFTIQEAICDAPSAIEISNIEETSAAVVWTENDSATEWEISYGESGFDPETEGTTIQDTDETIGETIAELEANTTYDIYVRAICAEDDFSEWAGPETFTTQEHVCDMPSDINISSITQHTAMLSWTENGDATQWEIVYGEAGFDPETQGTTLQDTNEEIGQALTELTHNTTYDVYVRAICAEDDYSEWAGPMQFTTLPGICATPSNITVLNVSQTTAEITWIENGDSSEWEIIYGEIGFDPDTEGTTLQDNDGEPGALIDGLTENTSYEVYVRAVCDDNEFTDMAGPEAFTTEPLSLENQNFEGFTYYPNPTKNNLSLSAKLTIDHITVYNLLGQKVIEQNPNSLTAKIDVANLANGAYLMKVSVNGALKTFRIIKE